MSSDHDPSAATAPRRLTLSEARDNPCLTCQARPSLQPAPRTDRHFPLPDRGFLG